jgi:hypothetical protein
MWFLECFDMNMEAGSSSISSITVYQSILHHMSENFNPVRNSRHKLHEKWRSRVYLPILLSLKATEFQWYTLLSMYKQLFNVINNKATPCVIYVFYGFLFCGKHLHGKPASVTYRNELPNFVLCSTITREDAPNEITRRKQRENNTRIYWN